MRGSHSALTRSMQTQRGFSLIELMVAITLGLIVLAGVTGIFSATVGTNSTVIKVTQLNQDLRAAMEFMSHDIRRSGYFSGDPTTENNPFQAEFLVAPSPGPCMLYAYDTKLDKALGNEDKLGFRLSEGAIQVRRSGAACDATGWENITDPNTVTVTNLQFTRTAIFCTNITTPVHTDCLPTKGGAANPEYVAPVAGNITLTTYDVSINLTGALKSDAATSVTLSQVVRIKNDSIRTI